MYSNFQRTSISSLYFSKGASMMFCSIKVLDSTSKWCPVKSPIRSQCLRIMDLFAINSSRGHDSLKSSMVLFRSRKACQSFSALGSFRHLQIEMMNNISITGIQKKKKKKYNVGTQLVVMAQKYSTYSEIPKVLH